MKTLDYSMRWVLMLHLASGIAMFTGCHANVSGTAKAQPSIKREEAVRIAEEEARRRGWREVQLEDVRFKNSTWFVLVQRLPLVPGGDALVEISPDGKIVQFRPGK